MLYTPYVALGTSSGSLLLYSIAKADLELKIDSETSQHVGCLSWCEGGVVYSGADNLILCFDLEKRAVKR